MMDFLSIGMDSCLTLFYLKHFLFAVLATVAFTVLFQGPKKVWLQGGIIGGLGWIIAVFLKSEMFMQSFTADFLATIVISLGSELAARYFKQPSTVFSVPAIIPIVPGLGLYQGMYAILEDKIGEGLVILLHAGLDSCAIALGIMLISGMFRAMKRGKRRTKTGY